MPGCPLQPLVPDPPPTAIGGRFTDCGLGPVGYRAPDPTAVPHALGDGGPLSGSSICLQPFQQASWWANQGQPILPSIVIRGTDRIIHNAAVFPADVVFEGSRIAWFSQPGFGAVAGEYVCAPGSDQIEVDGECLCPAPEPGVSLALGVGMLLLVLLSRRRG